MAIYPPIRVFHRKGNLWHLCTHTRPSSNILSQYEDKAFRVVNDTYVTAEDGTGIVHQAPAFGDDDHRILLAHGIISPEELPPCPIDDDGRFTKECPEFEGDNFKVADSKIAKMVKAKGRLIVQSTLMHSYPYCWRYVLIQCTLS